VEVLVIKKQDARLLAMAVLMRPVSALGLTRHEVWLFRRAAKAAQRVLAACALGDS
jgi:protein tyrosine phosphatase (PTP) superfamily phosphohydrolase (DUF442 family)